MAPVGVYPTSSSPNYKSHRSLKTKELPVKTGAALLDINRTSVYYKGTPISQEELDCKSIIDRLHTDNPAWGAQQLSAQLKKRGHQVGRRKTRRYMNEMGIDPIYPKMNLSKRMQQAKVCPYLLRNAVSTVQIRHGQSTLHTSPLSVDSCIWLLWLTGTAAVSLAGKSMILWIPEWS